MSARYDQSSGNRIMRNSNKNLRMHFQLFFSYSRVFFFSEYSQIFFDAKESSSAGSQTICTPMRTLFYDDYMLYAHVETRRVYRCKILNALANFKLLIIDLIDEGRQESAQPQNIYYLPARFRTFAPQVCRHSLCYIQATTLKRSFSGCLLCTAALKAYRFQR